MNKISQMISNFTGITLSKATFQGHHVPCKKLSAHRVSFRLRHIACNGVPVYNSQFRDERKEVYNQFEKTALLFSIHINVKTEKARVCMHIYIYS